MKVTKMFKSALFIAVVLFNGAAAAYSPEETEQSCKKPRFTDFNLTSIKHLIILKLHLNQSLL